MTSGRQPSIDDVVTPPHVWASLSCDRRAQVIAALAHLAVHRLATQAATQPARLREEVHDAPRID